MNVKENDVFRFQFNQEQLNKRFSPHHCFDGQFVAKTFSSGEIMLCDTYWGFGRTGDCTKVYSVAEALKNGSLTFVCNMADVEECNSYDVDYYDESDIFNLSHQHGCYKYYALKKGSVRSQRKMLEVLRYKIESKEREIKSLEWDMSQAKERLALLESGDTKIYI